MDLNKEDISLKRFLLRLAVYLGILVFVVGGGGVIGFLGEQKAYWYSLRNEPIPKINHVEVPDYNPSKPTAVVLLGSPTTEVFDFLVPYQMLAMTNAYNVFAVAPDKNVTSLTGGLDLLPHYSFEEMDQLLGKSPDLIVIPYMPIENQEKYKPVREWIQKHSDTFILSICGGAVNAADAGLLTGKSSTVHWQFFDQIKKSFTETNWIRDQRYVVGGEKIVSSAGLTSGIDATLYVISQQLGKSMAEKIAADMNYPTYHFVNNPKVDPYYLDRSEIIYLFNQAFQWNQTQTGVLLYDGMDDGELSAIYDTYAASGTTKVISISSNEQPIVTKYHLNLISKYQIQNAPQLDRLIVPGTEAKILGAEEVEAWIASGKSIKPEFLHSESAKRFMFDAPLEDLAKQEDKLTARFGAKRLEYRADYLQLEGNPFSMEAFGVPLFLASISLLLAYFIDRRFLVKESSKLLSNKTKGQSRFN